MRSRSKKFQVLSVFKTKVFLTCQILYERFYNASDVETKLLQRVGF